LPSEKTAMPELSNDAFEARVLQTGTSTTTLKDYMDAGASGVTLSRDTGQLAALLHQFRTYGVRVEFASGQDGLKLLA
jgi:hypothetical protein